MARITKWRGKQLLKKVDTGLNKNLGQTGKYLRGKISAAAPKDTGKLAASIEVKKEDDGVKVVANVEYAAAVELGTRHTRPQPFMRPTMMKEKGVLGKKVSKKIL